MKKRFCNIFVAISILLGSIFFGTYKMTLSASLGKIENENILARGFCKVLEIFLSDPDHCINEYEDYKKELQK